MDFFFFLLPPSPSPAVRDESASFCFSNLQFLGDNIKNTVEFIGSLSGFYMYRPIQQSSTIVHWSGDLFNGAVLMHSTREHTLDNAILVYSHNRTTFLSSTSEVIFFKNWPRYSERSVLLPNTLHLFQVEILSLTCKKMGLFLHSRTWLE